MIAMMLILAISASASDAKKSSGLSLQECRAIFPGANSSEATNVLESGVQWTEVWEHGSWGPPEEFLGYVFLKSFQHESQAIDVWVGMTKTGVISGVRVKGIAGVDEEFLTQFRGKASPANFDLARTPEDLLVVPAKLQAMGKNLVLSESIARSVKEIAFAAAQIVK